MAADTTVFRARYVAPMNGPVLDEGSVIVAAGGKIIAVGQSSRIDREAAAGAIKIDLGECVLLPGLVNAHTHLELSDIPRPVEMNGLVPWLAHVVLASAKRAAATAIATGARDSLRFGVTCVGDITREPAIARRVLRESGLRAVSFGEIAAMAERRGLLEERLAAAVAGSENEFVRIGISPHATYSVEPAGYRRCLAEAMARHLALATHIAESPDESAFLEYQTGPFREIWRRLGGWDDAVPRFAGGPIRLMEQLGLLGYPTLLAHVNYCDDAELAILARGRASVGYCPRTHAYFGHAPHRWREMLAVGVNVAVCTDSAASSGDLNLVDDLRLLHRLAPEFPVQELWEMATIRGAQGLRREHEIGSLEAGKWADMVAFQIESDNPLRELLESSIKPRQVWIAGKTVAD